MNTLKDEFQYLLRRQAEILRTYEGRVIVIKDEKVQHDFSSEDEAAKWAEARFEPDSFLILKCQSGREAQAHRYINPNNFIGGR
ncbi:MAG: hypothetical protein V4543_03975 [Bacteroidota bacterium]